jgi:serine/threonine-protein kinase
MPLDRRADVFSLGIVLWEMSTGRRLYRRVDPPATMAAILKDSVPPPSRLVPGFPQDLGQVCLRALARKREDRYATAEEMRRDLLRVMRQVQGDTPPQDTIVALMRELFAERIAEKELVLRRMLAGSTVTKVPMGEVDGAVELPDIPIELTATPITAGSSSEMRVTSARPPRLLIAWMALAIVLIGMVSMGAWWLKRERAVVPVSSTSSALAPMAPLVPAVSSAKPDRVIVWVETSPAGAHVLLEGVEQGTTPLSLEVARGNVPLSIGIRLTGYRPIDRTAIPNTDQQRIILELTRMVPVAPGTHPTSVRPPSRIDGGIVPW